jgi:hypothetical protein
VRSPNVLGQRVRGARLDVEHDMHQEAAEGAQAERHREPRRQGGALYGGMRTRALWATPPILPPGLACVTFSVLNRR